MPHPPETVPVDTDTGDSILRVGEHMANMGVFVAFLEDAKKPPPEREDNQTPMAYWESTKPRQAGHACMGKLAIIPDHTYIAFRVPGGADVRIGEPRWRILQLLLERLNRSLWVTDNQSVIFLAEPFPNFKTFTYLELCEKPIVFNVRGVNWGSGIDHIYEIQQYEGYMAFINKTTPGALH